MTVQRVKIGVETELRELRAWATANDLAHDDHGVCDSEFAAHFRRERASLIVRREHGQVPLDELGFPHQMTRGSVDDSG